MEIVYVYQKARRDFGRHGEFQDLDAEVICDIAPDAATAESYLLRDPQVTGVQCVPEQSESEANTERISLRSQGTNHLEGGWPKDIDSSEQDQKDRYTKKIMRDEDFIKNVRAIADRVDHVTKQNNAIDIYEDYFSGDYMDHSSEPPSAKTVTVFRDPSPLKRTASHISWSPTDGKKIAVAYCVLQFQKMPEGMSLSSYIWDINNANYPEQELTPASPVVCLEYNHKDPHILIGGCYNGILSFWDSRKGSMPFDSSLIEKSHRDPVYDVKWLATKTNTECMSCSTDGQVLFWDTRKIGEPIEVLQLEPAKQESYRGILGAVSLDYDPSNAAKFMVGTEQGLVLAGNRKAKTPADRIAQVYTGHHGPIYAVKRNMFAPKFFLTVGDWTARIWVDDITTPIMTTKYHTSYLTSGAWSPTRPGVFFTTKMDGTLDVWDYLYKQNDPVLSLQVSDAGLHTLKAHDDGRLIAVGSLDGSTSLLEVSDGLAIQQANEKTSIQQMFDREMRREKNLEQRAKELKQKQAKGTKKSTGDDMGGATEEEIQQITHQFMETTHVQEDSATNGAASTTDQSQPSESAAHSEQTQSHGGAAE
eukprot:ANDGO_03198.mRNA.1 Dynein intermediate chain 3